MKMTKHFLNILIVISLQFSHCKGYLEWTPWTLCNAACTGLRTRTCQSSTNENITKDECSPNFLRDQEQCNEKNCGVEASTTLETTELFDIDSTHKPSPDFSCQCGCDLTSSRGEIHTRIRPDKICTWNFKATPGNVMAVFVERLENFNWAQGGLYVASPKVIIAKYQGKEGGVKYDNTAQKSFTSIGNKMNLTIFSHIYSKVHLLDKIELKFRYTMLPDLGTGVKPIDPFEPTSKPKNPSNTDNTEESSDSGGSANIPLIASIVACIVVIIIATVVILYRKRRQTRKLKKETVEEEKTGFFGGNGRKIKSPRKDRGPLHNKIMLDNNGIRQGYTTDNGYFSGTDIPITAQPTYITAFPPTTYIAGRQYMNWPMPALNQAQLMPTYTYNPQSVEQITPTGATVPPVFYKSGGED